MRWALVGCGSVAPSHALALSAADDVTFVAVCDQDSTRAAEFATTYGVTAYTELDEMLDAETIEAVSIALPTALHPQVTATLAKRGVHVLCEKPFAPSTAECDEMIAACDGAGVALGVIHNYRGLPTSRWVADGIDSGRLAIQRIDIGGSLTSLQSGAPRSALAMLDAIGVHYADLLLWWLGPLHSVDVVGDDSQINATLHFADTDASLELSTSPVRNPGISITIQADQGTLIYDHTGVLEHRGDLGALPDPTSQVDGARYGPGHQVVIAEAAAQLAREGRFPLDGSVGRAAVEVTEQISAKLAPAQEGEQG